MGPLTERALEGLKLYQFKAGGYTWLDAAHTPVWNWIVERFPLWLAPNLITLTGTMGIVIAYILNIIYNPSFTGEAPAWVYWFTAASVAVYVNLDCMDGKQARRTKSSSPLGQLFDHGCDALALHMMLANIAASLGVGCGWKMAAGCLGIMLPWMFAQWEEYHTGVMMYGNNDFIPYGVLEANYSICVVHILSAVFGLRLWHAELPVPELLQDVLVQPVSVADAALLMVSFAGLVQAGTSISRVWHAPPLSPKEVGFKQLGYGWAALHLLGLLLSMGLGAASVALVGNTTDTCFGVAWCPCRVAYSMFGITYALTASQLILAHMAKEPWQPSVVALACPLLHVMSMVMDWPVATSTLLQVLHAVALVFYGVYVVSCCQQICAYLGIKCLTIPVHMPEKQA